MCSAFLHHMQIIPSILHTTGCWELLYIVIYDKVNTVSINYPQISHIFPLIPMESFQLWIFPEFCNPSSEYPSRYSIWANCLLCIHTFTPHGQREAGLLTGAPQWVSAVAVTALCFVHVRISHRPYFYLMAARTLPVLKMACPSSFTALFGTSPFNHVYIKTMKLQPIPILCLRVEV